MAGAGGGGGRSRRRSMARLPAGLTGPPRASRCHRRARGGIPAAPRRACGGIPAAPRRHGRAPSEKCHQRRLSRPVCGQLTAGPLTSGTDRNSGGRGGGIDELSWMEMNIERKNVCSVLDNERSQQSNHRLSLGRWNRERGVKQSTGAR